MITSHKQLPKVRYQVAWEGNDGEVSGHYDCDAATVPGAMFQVRKFIEETHGLRNGEFRVTEVYRI